MNAVIVYLPAGYRHDHFTLTVIEKSDATEAKLLEDKLRESRKELQESVAANTPETP